MYPTQYSKIVIEVKYCACPTSELNGWVIFVGKKSNYGLSQNCLRERRTFGYVFLLHLSPAFSCHSSRFSCSSFPFSLLLFSPSFHGLPSVLFLLFYTLLCFLSVCILSPVPPSCPPPSFPFFHSITTLSAPHMYHFHSIVFCFFLYLLIFHVYNII